MNDPFAGMILDYRHDFDQAKVSDYVEYCHLMRESCDKEAGGFWLQPRMSAASLFDHIRQLA